MQGKAERGVQPPNSSYLRLMLFFKDFPRFSFISSFHPRKHWEFHWKLTKFGQKSKMFSPIFCQYQNLFYKIEENFCAEHIFWKFIRLFICLFSIRFVNMSRAIIINWKPASSWNTCGLWQCLFKKKSELQKIFFLRIFQVYDFINKKSFYQYTVPYELKIELFSVHFVCGVLWNFPDPNSIKIVFISLFESWFFQSPITRFTRRPPDSNALFGLINRGETEFLTLLMLKYRNVGKRKAHQFD